MNSDLVDSILRKVVESEDVPGVVAMAATSERVFYQGAFGKRNVDAGEDMTLDSVFRIASMTKPITSVAAMQLVEEGVFDLDTHVSKFIPYFSELQVLEGFHKTTREPLLRPVSAPVTVRHLLTHTAGFGYPFLNTLLNDAVDAGLVADMATGDEGFLRAPLVFDPGERWHYGINTDWLGRLVETVRESTLDRIFAERIFQPLKMKDTDFRLPEMTEPRLATTHSRQQDGSLVESPQKRTEAPSFCSGGGGLFSTASDYIRFLRALMQGGQLDGARILRPETVSLMGQNQIGELEAGRMRSVSPVKSNDFDLFPGTVSRFGLGFILNGAPVTGGRASGSLAWAGIYNTYFWVDRSQDVCGVFMTQILPFFDDRIVDLFGEFERAIYREVT